MGIIFMFIWGGGLADYLTEVVGERGVPVLTRFCLENKLPHQS